EIVAQASADPRRTDRRCGVGVLNQRRTQIRAPSVSSDDEIGDDRVALRFAHRADRLETYGVARHLERLPRRECLLRVHGARLARRDGERDENDPAMYDVPAIPAAPAAQ